MSPKKSIVVSALLSLASASSSSHAATVGFGADPAARNVLWADLSTQVAVGSLVQIGTFTSEAFAMTPGSIAANVTAIQIAGGWTQFTGTSSLGISNVFGNDKIGGSVNDNAETAFNGGKNVYLWVFNATTIAGASQMGIFKATSATPTWIFPTQGGGVGDTVTLSTDPSPNTTFATIAAVGTTPVGFTSSTQLALAAPPTAVPEPSTFTFGALTALLAAGLRRRNRT